ncbi:MAG TPA: amino acid ABC transporter permease, partial [Firmicutes bacterium]|nr:amino acid ABC transporter permease [Bacillota bacterium]
EVVAGYALGFSFTTVMREIIIPAGRPGIMQMLNRRKMVMK